MLCCLHNQSLWSVDLPACQSARAWSHRSHWPVCIGSQYIKQWGSFLSSGKNKTELIQFLVSKWKSHDYKQDGGQYHNFWVNLQSNDESQLRHKLSCNHKDADTCMLLHAKQINDTHIQNIFINTSDRCVPDWKQCIERGQC